MAFRRLAAALAVVLVLGACAESDDDDDAGGGTTETTAKDEPVRGGTLVAVLGSDPGSLNPAVTSNGGVHEASEPMFNGLVGWGADGKPTPELAESWTIEEGGKVYRFKLRSNVKFHDGQPFTSADVKFTFDKALLPFHSRTKASMGSAGLTVEAPDASTVVFRFAAPYAPLLQQLNVTEAPIIPKHVFESCADISTVAGCPPNKNPIGTGPFKLVSYTINEIRMARHTEYFRAGQPYFDELVERVIPDQGTQVLALENKEIDWLSGVPGQDLQRLRGNSEIATVPAPRGTGGGNCITTVAFNMKPPAGRVPFLTDQKVRQALAQGTNRQQLFDQIQFGVGRIPAAPIHSKISFAHTPVTLPAFDVNRAKALLEEAGWKQESGQFRVSRGVQGVPDGTELAIDMFHFSGQQGTFAEALKGQWRAIGVNLTNKQSDNATLSKNVFTDRTYDTAIISYCNGDDPEIGVRRQYHSSQIGPTAFSNAAGYSLPEMDTLWDQAAREIDQNKRRDLYRQISTLAVRDLPYFWLAESENIRGHRANCKGFNYENTGLYAEGAFCKR